MKIKMFPVVLLALACSISLVSNVYAHDVDGDGYANWIDLKRVVLRFGDSGPPGWIPEDVNVDGVVDIRDIYAVAIQLQLTPANVNILPGTIYVPPEGPGLDYVIALIELPEADVHDIDPDSIDLVVPGIYGPIFMEEAESAVVAGKRMRVKFPAGRLIEHLRTAFPDPGLYSLEITVVGVVLPGTLTFLGTDVVNIQIG